MDSHTHAAPVWRTSSACPTGNSCVEIADLPGGGAAMRDNKLFQSPELRFAEPGWSAFIAAARAGEFDPGSRD